MNISITSNTTAIFNRTESIDSLDKKNIGGFEKVKDRNLLQLPLASKVSGKTKSYFGLIYFFSLVYFTVRLFV